MPAQKPFLTAQWRDVALVTYRIPADLLPAYLPRGLEPDRQRRDAPDVAYVSLVAFRFLDTRVKGVSIPLHRDFPEVNLRVYVRTAEGDRGVLFLSELVPKPFVAVVANVLYDEHYRAMPMTIDARDVAGGAARRLEVRIEQSERVHTMTLTGGLPPQPVPTDSREHFFKEHTWGFGATPDGELVRYRVDHPHWDVYPTSAEALELDIDFAELYGAPWDRLNDQVPDHVAYAVGSEVAVYPKS